MENDEYWKKYYRGRKKQEPSNFAEFCLSKISSGSVIVDLAAGDCWDTDLLATQGVCIAVEPHNDAVKLNYLHEVERADIVYARWFFHAVEEEVEDETLKWCRDNGATLMAEMRAEECLNDKSHWRRVVEPEKFKQKLLRLGFDILHYETSRGLPKVGDDDPLLTRVIAVVGLSNKRPKKTL